LSFQVLRREQQIAVDQAVALRWHARKPTELRRFSAKLEDLNHEPHSRVVAAGSHDVGFDPARSTPYFDAVMIDDEGRAYE
jgi:hypothetical protein